MKLFLSITTIFLSAFQVNAQVGIGTNTPNASAQLEVVSTSKGVLVPRMTDIQRGNISSPAEGLLVYQTSAPAGFYVYKSGAWVSVLDNSIGYLPLAGGTLTGALTGTTAAFNSIRTPILIGGTTTSSTITYKPTTANGTTGADHIFQVGNNGGTEAMRILNNGTVKLSTTAPSISTASNALVMDPSTGIVSQQPMIRKVSAYVNAGGIVTLGNINVRVSTGGNRSLEIAFTNAVAALSGSSKNTYRLSPASWGGSGSNAPDAFVRQSTVDGTSYWTAGTWIRWQAGADFPMHGSTQEILINDETNKIGYRITLIVGLGYNNNFICIERLD